MPSKKTCALILSWALTGWTVGQPQDVVRPEQRFPTPLRSSDNQIRVFGRRATGLEKIQILRIAEKFRARFSKFSGFSVESLGADIVLHSPDSDKEPPERITRAAEKRFGDWTATLHLQGPVGIEQLHQALAGSWISLRLADGDGPPDLFCPELPGWFVAGAARLAGGSHRADDTEQVLVRWMRAELPRVDFLLTASAREFPMDPPLAAELTDWILSGSTLPFSPESRRPSESRLAGVLERIPPGSAREPRAGLDWMTGSTLHALEESWTGRLLDRRRRVLKPGQTTPMSLSVFMSEMLLYAGEDGMPVERQWLRAHPLSLLISRRDRPWTATVAARKAARLRELSIGRGPELREAATKITRFLHAVQRRGSVEELEILWKQAAWDLDRLRFALDSGRLNPVETP